MNFKFEKLEIWQRSMQIGEEINNLANCFPIEEKYNLSSQIRRAMDSVALNISEGSIGQSRKEQRRFIGYSIRSLAEAVTCLFKAKNRNYIDDVLFKKYYSSFYDLMNMIVAFRRSIKS